ncbi:MAG: stage III sporulation protein AF [Oscillospiraceae bacterium]|nr:stage III sporulation protein AF [Oscillospiraceae bacterium]
MEAVKVWGFSMCAAVVIGSVVSMIAPSLEKHKMMKLIISAFVLAGVLSPMLNLIDEIDLSLQASAENVVEKQDHILDENMLNKLENSVSQSLFPLIDDELDALGLSSDFGINTELKQSEDRIEIECVNITVMDLHKIDKDNLKAALERNLGLTIKINALNAEENTKNE